MGCLFCDIAEKRRPSEIVHEDEDLIAFRDIDPQAPTHILVIPRRHVATVNDLVPEDAGLAGRMVLTARELAEREGIAEKGYRLVWNCNEGGGQAVYHLHLHLLGGRAFRWPPG